MPPVRSKSSVLWTPHNIWQRLSHSKCSITLLTFGKSISLKKCQKKCLEIYAKAVVLVELFGDLGRVKESLKRQFPCTLICKTFSKHLLWARQYVLCPRDAAMKKACLFFSLNGGFWQQICALKAVRHVRKAGREVCTKCESVTGSFVGRAAWDGYFFRLTQVAYISTSVYCVSDFENKNDIKIENGIESLGNGSRSGLGRIHTNCVKQEAQIEQKSISLGFTTMEKYCPEDSTLKKT